MTWMLRNSKHESPSNANSITGGDVENYTIPMFHCGRFNNNFKKYEGGTITYIDHCNSDEMSLVELGNMTKEIGIIEYFRYFHYVSSGELKQLVCDNDAYVIGNYVDSGRIIDVFVENVDEQNLHIVESVIIEPMRSFEKTIIPDAHAWRVYYDINDNEEESSHSCSDGEEPNSSEEDVEFDPLHDTEYEMDEDHGLKMHQLNMIEKMVMKT
ncbi:hypothetical protein LIER_13194 [Lithospermum erythrorhizon]|uniref:PB1-like domain-containing protein n=1 Tax=Lithospermum erythrorhizon TaxID=34254 RepID=A0AAV3PZ51_LITER